MTDLYEEDFFIWCNQQAKYIKNKEFDKLDIDHLVDEVESLGKSQKDDMRECLIRLIASKMKRKFNLKDTYEGYLDYNRTQVINFELYVKDNSSLKNYPVSLDEIYFFAKLRVQIDTDAGDEIFPEKCPWTVKELMKNYAT